MKEEWKDIPGWENRYQVSKNGQVRSVDQFVQFGSVNYLRKGVNRKTSTTPKGYVYVILPGPKLGYIHRLVALTFIPNPENKPEVNHKNAIKSDNHVSNLEWVTRLEQMQHASINKLMKPGKSMTGKFGKDNHSSLSVIQYDINMNFIAEHGSLLEAQRTTGVDASEISKFCRGFIKRTPKGFKWKYKKDIL